MTSVPLMRPEGYLVTAEQESDAIATCWLNSPSNNDARSANGILCLSIIPPSSDRILWLNDSPVRICNFIQRFQGPYSLEVFAAQFIFLGKTLSPAVFDLPSVIALGRQNVTTPAL